MKIIEIEDLRQLEEEKMRDPAFAHFISITRKLKDETRTLRERTELLGRLHKHLKKEGYVMSGECYKILLRGKERE